MGFHDSYTSFFHKQISNFKIFVWHKQQYDLNLGLARFISVKKYFFCHCSNSCFDITFLSQRFQQNTVAETYKFHLVAIYCLKPVQRLCMKLLTNILCIEWNFQLNAEFQWTSQSLPNYMAEHTKWTILEFEKVSRRQFAPRLEIELNRSGENLIKILWGFIAQIYWW